MKTHHATHFKEHKGPKPIQGNSTWPSPGGDAAAALGNLSPGSQLLDTFDASMFSSGMIEDDGLPWRANQSADFLAYDQDFWNSVNGLVDPGRL